MVMFCAHVGLLRGGGGPVWEPAPYTGPPMSPEGRAVPEPPLRRHGIHVWCSHKSRGPTTRTMAGRMDPFPAYTSQPAGTTHRAPTGGSMWESTTTVLAVSPRTAQMRELSTAVTDPTPPRSHRDGRHRCRSGGRPRAAACGAPAPQPRSPCRTTPRSAAGRA